MKPEQLRGWLSAAGGRTFLMTVGAGLVDSTLVWFHRITSGDFVLVTTATVGAYIAANAYQRVKGPSNAQSA